MKQKKLSIQKTIIVLLLTIIIFSTGVLIGNYNTDKKFSKVVDLTSDLRIETLGMEVEYDILESQICENENVLYLVQGLFELAEKITFMENELGADNENVIQLKKQYFVLEARHWMLAKKRVDECPGPTKGLDNTIILYFYSNEGDCPQCQQQGAVLTHLHQKHEKMKIYSFDSNIDSPVVNVLKTVYGINATPGLVINEETHIGFLSADEFVAFVTNQQKTQVTENIMKEIST